MFYLESERLRLIPLTNEMFHSCLKDRAAFETSLGLIPSQMEVEEFFKKEYDDAIVNFWLPNLAAFPDQYLWITNWEIVSLEHNTIIGGIGMAGMNLTDGAATTGYMIDKKHWNKGYATEALNLICQWAFTHEHVLSIKATTLKDGYASQKVLGKAGFVQIGADEQETHFQKIR